MPMKNPPHPGGFVLRQCIEPLGLTITDAAAALGVTRTTLSELVHGHRGISPEMAVRLSKVFGGSAQSWLTQQAQYDLAHVRGRPHQAEAAGVGLTDPAADRQGQQAHQGRRYALNVAALWKRGPNNMIMSLSYGAKKKRMCGLKPVCLRCSIPRFITSVHKK